MHAASPCYILGLLSFMVLHQRSCGDLGGSSLAAQDPFLGNLDIAPKAAQDHFLGSPGVASKAAQDQFLALFPLGGIIAWVSKPYNSVTIPAIKDLSLGWVICDGRKIEGGPWKGLRTPNLNGPHGFLRGGDMDQMLSVEEDTMADHEHNDPGHKHQSQEHSHSDSGHSHTDDGHTHLDKGHTHRDVGHTHEDQGHTHSDRGHDHKDSGHTHKDGGHSHKYTDNYICVKRGRNASGWYWGGGHLNKRTTASHANILASKAQISKGYSDLKSSYANITTGEASIQSGKASIMTGKADIRPGYAKLGSSQIEINKTTSNIGGVNRGGEFKAKVGTETKPKSVRVIWIMKCW